MATSARDTGDAVAVAGTLNTTVVAVSAAGLDGMLKGVDPFPVFALADDVFAKLTPGMVESLLMLKTRRS
ncbi:MAG: hypothetical protein ACRYHQ_06010 [Janthinobacterium lividum]